MIIRITRNNSDLKIKGVLSAYGYVYHTAKFEVNAYYLVYRPNGKKVKLLIYETPVINDLSLYPPPDKFKKTFKHVSSILPDTTIDLLILGKNKWFQESYCLIEDYKLELGDSN